jgi:hypothetical protein
LFFAQTGALYASIKEEKRYTDERLRCLDENPFLLAFEAKKIAGGQRT